jgi:hypothetical protein
MKLTLGTIYALGIVVSFAAEITSREFVLFVAFELHHPPVANMRLDTATVRTVERARCVDNLIHADQKYVCIQK